MRRLVAAVVAVVLACLIAGCGSGHGSKTTSSTVAKVALSQACPPGDSQMGCSIVETDGVTLGTIAGERIPDVSSYQGTVNWGQVKAWEVGQLKGAIFKLGEYELDPYAIQNAQGIRAAGMIAIGYVFVRPGVSAQTMLRWARMAGVKVVVLDEEVAGIQGVAAEVTPALRAAGLVVVDYHSAGNVFDTSAQGLPCWVAAYGPTTPPVCTTGQRVAWQLTDAGSVTGISGQVDLSITYGLLRLGVVNTKLICFNSRGVGDSTAAACKPIIAMHTWLVSRRNHWFAVMQANKAHPNSAVYKHARFWWLTRRGNAYALWLAHS